MTNKNTTYKILSFFFLTTLIVIVFGIYPLCNGIKKSSNDLISIKNETATINDQSQETQNFENNFSLYKPTLDKIDGLFVDFNNPVDFIKFLEDTALKNNLTSKISLSQKGAQTYADQQFESNESAVFTVSVDGAFEDILKFTNNIEYGPYLIKAESLTIQNSEKITEKGKIRTINAQFLIKVFLQQKNGE